MQNVFSLLLYGGIKFIIRLAKSQNYYDIYTTVEVSVNRSEAGLEINFPKNAVLFSRIHVSGAYLVMQNTVVG